MFWAKAVFEQCRGAGLCDMDMVTDPLDRAVQGGRAGHNAGCAPSLPALPALHALLGESRDGPNDRPLV